MLKFKSLLFITIFSVISNVHISAQDEDIVPYLKLIENGEKDKVNDKLASLKKKYPDSPSIMFLEGVLTDDGGEAVLIYSNLIKKFPQSKYADASLYRIYTYNFAAGKYPDAKSNLVKLKENYPQSPYIKLAEREIPPKNEYIIMPDENAPGTDNSSLNIDSASYKYTIQAGAFTVADNAKTLKTELDSAGFYTKLEDKTVAGAVFHIVYAGKFVNRDDAKSQLAVLNKKFGLNGRIVNITTK